METVAILNLVLIEAKLKEWRCLQLRYDHLITVTSPEGQGDVASPWPEGPPQGLLYSPINTSSDSIRLLHIHQAEDGVIEGTLRASSFSDKPAYIAQSYVWGSSTKNEKTIQVNGSTVRVQENLWHALGCIISTGTITRKGVRPKRAMSLWIDSTCIDQTDTAERAIRFSTCGRYTRGPNSSFLGWVFRQPRRTSYLATLTAKDKDNKVYAASSSTGFSGGGGPCSRSGHDPPAWVLEEALDCPGGHARSRSLADVRHLPPH